MSFPKPERVVNKALINSYRGKSCALCGKNEGTVGHHIKTRGAGGGDVRENLVPLCVSHHAEVHNIGSLTFAKKYNLE